METSKSWMAPPSGAARQLPKARAVPLSFWSPVVAKSLSLDQIRRMQEGRAKAKGLSIQSIQGAKPAPMHPNPLVARRLAEMPQSMRKRYISAMSGRRPLGAIHAFCRECMGWEGLPESVANCKSEACPLFPYRPGAEK